MLGEMTSRVAGPDEFREASARGARRTAGSGVQGAAQAFDGPW